MKNLLTIVLFLISFAIITFLVAYLYYKEQLNKEFQIDDPIFITIEKGATVDEIILLLISNTFNFDKTVFKTYLYLNPDKVIQAGEYRIATGSYNLPSVIEIFRGGTFSTRLTFLEGWRIEEYYDYLLKQMGQEFATNFLNSEFTKEGYMFPDTYIIDKNYPAVNLASWMRNNFDLKVTEELRNQAVEKGLSIEEVVILASIIEREMNIKADRRIVSGILIKRLRNGWPIQADATVQYVKGNLENWWPIVTRDDLSSLDSPFNTYRNSGLPPFPISNPGYDSILSVIQYEESSYWFYITGRDGKTYYAETLDQHNINVDRYIRGN